ncbi:MAG: UDP-N-acetylmuramoyl-L-alanine--D-glutamate ligase, partial [Peptococcaceae bacterium]|nr:UDP-N-acetylmuramoyl-L-alanine--D-glutamate ligase [Peptococcaceae bacterium]
MDLAGKRVLVVGAGKSGLAAVRKLLSMKAEVFLTDKQSLSKLQGVKELALSAQQLILGQEPDLDHLQPDLIVLSPGVSPELPFIQKALKQKLPVWSEVELALRATPATVVGVTGSNGKTTTTTLLGVLAQATGKKTTVAGNIGTALSGLVDNLNQGDIIVAELSSFQLELIQ